MNLLILISTILVSFFLLKYGIKRFFDYKISQGKEGSNATIRKAIGSLLIGLFAFVGLTPYVADIFVQSLNNIPGIEVKANPSSELFGIIAYIIFCIAVIIITYIYYWNRHKLHITEARKSEVKSSTNIQQIMNHGTVKNQTNINEINGDFYL